MKIVYYLYQSKYITKKVYNNVSKLTQIWKISKPHVLRSELTGKLGLRRCEKSIAFSNISSYNTWIKNEKLIQQ